MIRPHMLRTAVRPFVSRALRGGRGRRIAALGLLLTALSGVLGIWLALGTGDFERSLRDGLELEEGRFSQERARFVVIADDDLEAARMRREIERRASQYSPGFPDDTAGYRVRDVMEEGARTLHTAALSAAPRGRDALQERARVAWEAWSSGHKIEDNNDYRYRGFDWYDAREVRALEAVIARGNVPAVEVYASPLGPIDALRLAGVIAGGALIILLMLAAPVLAGTQMAQETHENTLQPLAGSALRAEELAIGLSSGPVAIAGVLAAPQLVLFLVAAVVAGDPCAALWLVVTAVAGGAFLIVLAQLAGLALGKLRSPGLVGGGLAAVLGILGGVGLALAAELGSRTAGMLALLPQAAASHALAQTFALGGDGPGLGGVVDTTVPVAIGALGMLCLGYIGLRALARRIGQTTASALRGVEALVAAGVTMLLVTCANPYRGHNAEEFYLLNLGVLAVPFAILLMMRAPTGDVPPAMRRTPVGPLVGEFAGWAAVYLAVAAGMVGLDRMHALAHPIAALYLVWFVVVAALLSLRVAVAPLTFASRLWVGLCAMAVAVSFGQTAMWARSAESLSFRTPPIFIFSELSPFLGAVQAALTIAIPWILWRALRRPMSVAGEA